MEKLKNAFYKICRSFEKVPSCQSSQESRFIKAKTLWQIPEIYSFAFSEKDVVAYIAAFNIHDLIVQNYEKLPWLSFSQSCRYIYINNSLLKKEDLKKVSSFPEDVQAHLLGIASMNANGYIREAALGSLEKLYTPQTIPYLLILLNDWVPVIRNAALKAFQNNLKRYHPIDLIKNYVLIEWLKNTHRADYVDLQEDLSSYIKLPKFRNVIFLYLENVSVKENLFYWNLAGQGSDKEPAIFDMYLQNKHPEVRKLALNYLSSDRLFPVYIEEFCQDSSIRVRYAALKSIPQTQGVNYKFLFEKALFDRSKKIREYGRYVLKTLGVQEFRNYYKTNFGKPSSQDKQEFLLGWLDVVHPEDLPDIQTLLSHSIAQVRLAAYQALARNEPSRFPNPYLVGIKDSNGKVRKFCTHILKGMAPQVKEELGLLLEESHPKIQIVALIALTGLAPLEALKFILFAITLPHDSVKARAWKDLSGWYSRYGTRPYFSLNGKVYDEVVNLYTKIEREENIPVEYDSLWRGKGASGGLLQLLKLA